MTPDGEDGARDAGRVVGAVLDCDAGMCPWLQHRHPDLRRAWLAGFSERRIARIRLAAAARRTADAFPDRLEDWKAVRGVPGGDPKSRGPDD